MQFGFIKGKGTTDAIFMVRQMQENKLKDRFPSKELRERLGIDDTALVLQQNTLRWYGHVLRVKKCMEYEVEGPKTKRKTKEDVERGCPRGLSSM